MDARIDALSELLNVNTYSLTHSQWEEYSPSSVAGDSQESEHVGSYRDIRDEVVDHTEDWSKHPGPVSHKDKGEDAVEGGQEDIRHRQIYQEVVCHAPHAPMS